MKFPYLILSLLVTISGCNEADSGNEGDNDIEVYISTGEVQCQDNGLPISLTKSYLADANIEIKAESCGNLTSINYPSVCGGETGKLHVFTIGSSDAHVAENIGFTIPDSSVAGSEYAKIECDA